MEIKSSAYFLKMNFLPNGTLHLQEKIVLRKIYIHEFYEFYIGSATVF